MRTSDEHSIDDQSYLQFAAIKYLALLYSFNGPTLALATQTFIAWGFYTETSSADLQWFGNFLTPILLTVLQLEIFISQYIEHTFLNLIFLNDF